MNRMLLTVVALGAILTTAVFAEKEKGDDDQPKKRPPAGMEGLLPPPLVEKLNLTAAQKAELDRLEKEFAAARKQHAAEHKDQAKKLRAEMKAARASDDKAKAKELGGQMRELHKPVMELRRSSLQQFTATLSAEQKATWDAHREQMKKRRGNEVPLAD